MDACEGHENQSQALIQYAPSEIPTGVLFPQLTALSLEPQHYFLAPARAPALISKVGHSRGLRPLPPTPRKNQWRGVRGCLNNHAETWFKIRFYVSGPHVGQKNDLWDPFVG